MLFKKIKNSSCNETKNKVEHNNMIELPIKEKISKPKASFAGLKILFLIILVVFASSFFGFFAGLVTNQFFASQIKDYFSKWQPKEVEPVYIPLTSQEEIVINVVKEVSPAVVSIIVTKDLPVFEEYFHSPFEELREFFDDPFFEFRVPQYAPKETEKREIGAGTGFIISKDGMILTNAHVVFDKKADYTVLTNDGRKFSVKEIHRDPVQDLAILKIEQERGFAFPFVKIGDSDKIRTGQTVIAIGNVLGEFQNTVSKGVISGLGRTITAAGGGMITTIEDVIQTDAAINRGNSGGPLLNLKGEIIGINTAMVVGGENIGFAIPINKAKRAIEQVKTLGKIVYPFLGVRYVLITDKIQKENNLPVNYGAWIIGDREPAIFPGSAAEKAGLKENDIILEFNGQKITLENSLAKIIMKYNPGDQVVLKILRNGKEKTIEVTLGQKSE